MRASQRSANTAVPELHVHTPDGRVLRFSQPFRIGRDHDCDVRINEAKVSRRHASGAFEDGAWCIRDLKSANGLHVDGRRVETIRVDASATASLGVDGPSLTFVVEGHATSAAGRATPAATVLKGASDTQVLKSYEERYFSKQSPDAPAGGQTRMIRRAFASAQRKQRRRYMVAVGVVAIAGLVAAGVAYYKHRQVQEQQARAQEIFYAMKALDLDIANLERLLAQSGNAQLKEQARQYMARRRDAESTYDRLLAVRQLYDANLSEEDRLILRVTRLFGECELAAPEEYLSLVKQHIRRWRSTPRFERGVKLAQQLGYTKFIADEFIALNLPPQFFYLALQESDFNAFTSGPPTYMGIAKGMWQFIPDTGARYGLTIGPLAKQRTPDPGDDRHNWQKATTAAARYIKDIYATDAQASGLLVMASYNWGENRVINLLRSMPSNPQERNLWKVLERHRARIPDETYGYVFNIVSAAVIGENPRLFGFNFDNPLAFVDKQTAAGLPLSKDPLIVADRR